MTYTTEAYLRRFVILGEAEYRAVALWIAHTHAFDAAEFTPYLAITSAEKACGKTRLLDTLNSVVANPRLASHTTAAYLARIVERERPTLLIDEADTVFGGERSGGSESLRNVLNSGFYHGGTYAVCEGDKSSGGSNYEPKEFSTFCPKAIACIGVLPETVASRSISIPLRRKLRHESVERFRARDIASDADELRSWIAAWGELSARHLSTARPDVPEVLPDRAADIWEPLLAIAEAGGNTWALRGREAAVQLSAAKADEESSGARLLDDLRSVLTVDRMPSDMIVAALCLLEESPWGGYSREWGQSLTPRDLAKLLKPYGIRPKQIRFPGVGTKSGYLRGAFEDAWDRYLGRPDDSNTSNIADSADAETVGVVEGVGATTPYPLTQPF